MNDQMREQRNIFQGLTCPSQMKNENESEFREFFFFGYLYVQKQHLPLSLGTTL